MKFKRIIPLIILILTIITFNMYSYAFLGDIISGGEGFRDSAISAATAGIGNAQGFIITLAQTGMAIGVVIAIVVGLILGIKFMTDGAFGKAEIKEALTPYLIGCAVLFGSYAIWATIVLIGQEF